MITRRSLLQSAAAVAGLTAAYSTTRANSAYADGRGSPASGVEPITQRHLVFGVYNFGSITAPDDFRARVDEAASLGFTAVRVHVPWSAAVSTEGDIDFSPFDDQIDYVVNSKNLRCALNIDHLRQFADGSDAILPASDVMIDAEGRTYLRPFGPVTLSQFSLASASAVQEAAEFTYTVVNRYHDMIGDAILYVSPALSGYAELEYWPNNFDTGTQAFVNTTFDYSQIAVHGFRHWLEDQYRTIGDLNDEWNTSFASFADVTPQPASFDSTTGTYNFSGQSGISWYLFRHAKLKDMYDAFATAIHSVRPRPAFLPQVGSTYDALSPSRGTILFPELAEHTDAWEVDDAPTYDHPLSMDLLRGSLPPSFWLANETGNPADPADQIIQLAAQSYEHGAAVISVSNYDLPSLQSSGQVFQQIADQYLGEPVSNPPRSGSMSISAQAVLDTGLVDQDQYNTLSNNGAHAVRVKMDRNIELKKSPHRSHRIP